jgi:hypothetical protein
MPDEEYAQAQDLVLFQQSYARSHESGIEQLVGLFGVAEMLFRHPERLFIH